jgi:hypothetical protein
MRDMQALAVSSEREADSEIIGKEPNGKQEMQASERIIVLAEQALSQLSYTSCRAREFVTT